MSELSIVFPIFNEISNQFFWESLERLCVLKKIEIILVDGGSDDGTLQKLAQMNFCVLNSSPLRGQRINDGVSKAKSRMILLHHPRSLLEPNAIEELLQMDSCWGGFRHCFDWEHILLRFTSWYSNFGRRLLWRILYLDHCLFFPQSQVKNIFPLPAVGIFEDTYLSYALRRSLGRPKLLKSKVITSSIRFRQRGLWRQSLLNQGLKIKFLMGVSSRELNRPYEKGLELNSKLP